MVLDDFHTREKHRKEGRDQLLHRQGPQRGPAFGPRSFLAGLTCSEFDEAVDVVGHLDPREMLGAVFRLAYRDRQVQAQPADKRERVGGIDGQRGQDGEDLFVEIGRQSVALSLIQIGPGDDVDAFLAERG
ncbi:Uncharacterised protein [Mycobacterium tuberculosis]|nr:Uncharacterised protein [Mycobacterium tuberculosis]